MFFKRIYLYCHVSQYNGIVLFSEDDLLHDQYLAYRKWHYKTQLGADMTSEELVQEQCVIGRLSKGYNDRIPWRNFLNYEALKLLKKRNEVWCKRKFHSYTRHRQVISLP